jgi:DNA mismatch repair protein MutS
MQSVKQPQTMSGPGPAAMTADAVQSDSNSGLRKNSTAGGKIPTSKTTPMMAQFFEIKANNPDSLLFYRMGDFYEMFFQDAEVASRALGIALTKRGQYQGLDVPMCGVPVHAADNYLQKLIRLGHRVAVCEQLEDPAEAKKRGAKAVVRRDVIRLVTPGTLTEDSLLDARRNNFLAAVAGVRSGDSEAAFAISWVDLSTGAFHVAATHKSRIASDLARLEASEVLVAEPLYEDPDWRDLWMDEDLPVVPLTPDYFDSSSAAARLSKYFNVATLDSYGAFSRAELAASGAIIAYVDATQVGQQASISPPRRENASDVMEIDPATRANLELFRTTAGDARGSLFAVVDQTVTPAGARMLASRMASPLTRPECINRRLDAVSHFADLDGLRDKIRNDLAASADLARALSRLALGRGGPRDLGALRDGIRAAALLHQHFDQSPGLAPTPDELVGLMGDLLCSDPDTLSEYANTLGATLADELPAFTRDGGFVQAGHDAGLDDARALRDESRKVIAALQSTYRDSTEIKALKIKHNNVLGYFVEVPGQHGSRMLAAPLNETYIHRQTLANVYRFTTTELGELESRIAASAERALAIETEIFETLSAQALVLGEAIKTVGEAMAALDCHAALAELARTENWCRPEVDDSTNFEIEAGRHPVVEAALKKSGDAFIANNSNLGSGPTDAAGRATAGAIWLLTGPNMAGKSTFLRQNAILAILAQLGSFVPAKTARIGIVDRLFSRVGASDDLARGRSTFMVEMVETAAILNQAGPKSLVILDEIGRGTATFDGLSIAWATVEHLHEVNGSRALFATHYHELTSLTEKLERLQNATMKVKEWQGEVVFLHEVAPGASDRSYGIQVARLAGLPASVVARASEVLNMLESGDKADAGARLNQDLPLFAASVASAPAPTGNPVYRHIGEKLEALIPDNLTPRDALEMLYELKGMLRGDGGGR